MFQGAGEIIPGGATLFFDIEVIMFFRVFQENKGQIFQKGNKIHIIFFYIFSYLRLKMVQHPSMCLSK